MTNKIEYTTITVLILKSVFLKPVHCVILFFFLGENLCQFVASEVNVFTRTRMKR